MEILNAFAQFLVQLFSFPMVFNLGDVADVMCITSLVQVRGALETVVGALTPIDHVKGPTNEVQPALMNADLLSREPESISLILSLLVRSFGCIVQEISYL